MGINEAHVMQSFVSCGGGVRNNVTGFGCCVVVLLCCCVVVLFFFYCGLYF
jgi:hypothetical protein